MGGGTHTKISLTINTPSVGFKPYLKVINICTRFPNNKLCMVVLLHRQFYLIKLLNCVYFGSVSTHCFLVVGVYYSFVTFNKKPMLVINILCRVHLSTGSHLLHLSPTHSLCLFILSSLLFFFPLIGVDWVFLSLILIFLSCAILILCWVNV